MFNIKGTKKEILESLAICLLLDSMYLIPLLT